MKNQKLILGSILLLLLVGALSIMYQLRYAPLVNIPENIEKCDPLTTTADCKSISLDTSTWKVFENKKYGYAISYPTEGYITSSDDYGSPEHMLFSLPGRTSLGGVDATLYPNYPLSDIPPKDLKLKLYAEEVRMLQINYLNPEYNKDQLIGDLKETAIANKKAYEFTLDQGFTTQKKIGLGYVIPSHRTYLYTITENLEGQKIMIYYDINNPIAVAMFKTFRFLP